MNSPLEDIAIELQMARMELGIELDEAEITELAVVERMQRNGVRFITPADYRRIESVASWMAPFPLEDPLQVLLTHCEAATRVAASLTDAIKTLFTMRDGL